MLTCKLTRKRLLGRVRCTWEKNIRIYVKEIGTNARNWIDSALHRGY